MIIVGKTACGKTKYLLDMLERDHMGAFQYIFLICPTFENNTMYREWKYEGDEGYIVIPCDQDHVARHYKFSTIVVTQQLTSIAKPYRENISKLVSLYNPNKKDMQEIFDDYLGSMSKLEEESIRDTLKSQRYSRLEISLEHPYSHNIKI